MKTTLKIIQYKDDTWGAKKKNCFGQWRYFNHYYTIDDHAMTTSHYSWLSSPPDRVGCVPAYNDKFIWKEDVVKFLKNKYHIHRLFEEKE